MNWLLTFIISIFEWFALITFPIVLLGYYYRKYFRSVVIISILMSLISFFLHALTHLPVAVIVTLQIVILSLVIKTLLKFNLLESLTITSIGYGFYVFFQMIFIELAVQLSSLEHLQFYHLANIKYTTQIITFLIVYLFCYVLHYYKIHLNEIRMQLKTPFFKNQYKVHLTINFILMVIFLYLNCYFMLLDNSEHKFAFLLIIFIVLVMNLLSYLFLHMKFQNVRIIESKKILFDQEQQVAKLLERVQENYENHFNAILKLYEKKSYDSIKEYITHHLLAKNKTFKNIDTFSYSHLANEDEILFTFLINKQKLAGLLGIKIDVHPESHVTKLLSLQHIRYLNIIFDNLIILFYKTATKEEKIILFKITSDQEYFTIEISSDVSFNEEQIPNLKIFDALLQFKNHQSNIIKNEFAPLNITIVCPFS